MKQEIIKQLRSELFQSHWCISDFERFDVPALEHSNEPFLILFAGDFTHLVHCGARAISSLFATEADRMAMWRDKNRAIALLLSYEETNTPHKLFYYDGFSLKRFDLLELRELWHNLIYDFYEHARNLYSYEAAIANEPLEIEFASDEASQAYTEALKKAGSLGDDSLVSCFMRLRRWRRKAVNHLIIIRKDCYEDSFLFQERINGVNSGVNGGIVFNPDSDSRHWSIHT